MTLSRFRGCLLAGAVGDALGGPIEFAQLAQIRRTYGDRIDLAALPDARFTDDTQMTLFTAEGLIRANIRGRLRGITTVAGLTHQAYLRWLHTQGEPWPATGGHSSGGGLQTGWLVANQLLHRRAAPGNTCLSALRSGRMGTPTERINDSKGCGGVMRVAPVGLVFDDAERAFAVGCEVAAITHGHPSGFISAGALAAMVSRLVAGTQMAEAVDVGRDLAAADPEGAETVAALDAAIELAAHGVPTAEELEQLGGGWVGEEALAIAVACALTAEDVASGLSTAVLHSGDSDSTGAICGNLLGAQLGIDAVPAAWVELLEGADIVDAMARDLWTERYDPPTADDGDITEEWRQRYF